MFRRGAETNTRDLCVTQMMTTRRVEVPIESLGVSAYTIPTETPEADGTYEWDTTTIVVVEVTAGGKQGLGYTYADTATAKLIDDKNPPPRVTVGGTFQAAIAPFILRFLPQRVRIWGLKKYYRLPN